MIFQTQIKHLVGDVLLATGFLSYAGPFNQEYRSLLLDLWKKDMMQNQIPFSPVRPLAPNVFVNSKFFLEQMSFTPQLD